MVLSVIFCKVQYSSSKQLDIFEKVYYCAWKTGVFPDLQQTPKHLAVVILPSLIEQCLLCNLGLATAFESLQSHSNLSAMAKKQEHAVHASWQMYVRRQWEAVVVAGSCV